MARLKKEFIVKENALRLDLYLSYNLEVFTRSQIKRRNVEAFKKSNGKFFNIKLSKPVFKDDEILIEFDEESSSQIDCLRPNNIPIVIIYEDSNIIVLNKPQGILSHPGISHWDDTVVNFLLYHIKRLEINFDEEKIRPGIVHRLDKDTSGVIICAKNISTLRFLAQQFKDKRANKVYIAIVKGNFNSVFGSIESFIDRDKHSRKRFGVSKDTGKKALTEYRLLLNFGGYSLLALKPKTGRTHQLRVHMKYLNFPILGDGVYGRVDSSFKEITLMLHSYKLEIDVGKNSFEKFISEFPQRFVNFLLNFYKSDELKLIIDNLVLFLRDF
ncbi:RluA family pseudouridine synthase [Borrelia sp. CA_690]|uniref:Pseudouridine synthase n=1 Tax=Borrelia maritima TaxID=2761123 RepID=A0A5J6WAW8_9SPIR|nr:MULTISPECIES: RluA family pseudouridine synthase [Borrelia]QFI14181.1 RluA family pseudouridine synthase [Borrelia maritima]WKC84033.1 RluA family pseudouridine synthase [Borrelia sp. CA_690]